MIAAVYHVCYMLSHALTKLSHNKFGKYMYLIDIESDACVNFAEKYKHKQPVLMLKLVTSNWLLSNAQALGCYSAGHFLDTVDQHLLFSYFLNNISYC